MSRIISALILIVAATTAFAAEPIRLADDVPDRHIVTSGDTLWGIAGKFLKEPWRWPEIWRMNKDDIRNPHRIYPGDIVYLDRSGDQPRLLIAQPVKLAPKVYSTNIREEIPSIPPDVIEAFLSRPLVIEEKQLDSAPRIIAAADERVVMGNGDRAFVVGIGEVRPKWYLYRPGDPLKDPDTGEILGYEALFLGSAKLTDAGMPAVIELLETKQEVNVGDRLVPAAASSIQSYMPHDPSVDVRGRVIAIYGGVGEGGKFSIVSINRGARDGLEKGNVLALHRNRDATFKDGNGRQVTMALPEDRYGLMFVFRTFERVSYGLVLESSGSLIMGDIVKNP